MQSYKSYSKYQCNVNRFEKTLEMHNIALIYTDIKQITTFFIIILVQLDASVDQCKASLQNIQCNVNQFGKTLKPHNIALIYIDISTRIFFFFFNHVSN